MKRTVFGLLVLLSAVTGCRSMPEPLKLQAVSVARVVELARPTGLVPVQSGDSTIRVDLRYATPDNVFKQVLYPSGFPALTAAATAKKLVAANRFLKAHGFGLKVLDAYRPPEVQWQLFQKYQDDRYVADPRKKWSKHCYGRAVDVTVVDLAGREQEMPSSFDDFSKKAAAAYSGPDAAVRHRLALLQRAMTTAGFSLYRDEWWHFNDLSDPAALSGQPVFGKEIGL